MKIRRQSSLLVRLLGAFLLVIIIGALVIYFLTTRATRNAFRIYTTQSGRLWAEQLAPTFAEYYTLSNSWQGVEALLRSEWSSAMPGMMGRQDGAGQNHGQGQGMMMGMGQRFILADADGQVLVDTSGELTGRALSADELAAGAPILAQGRQVGALIVTPASLEPAASPAGAFLTSVNRSILIAVLIAAVISLVLVLIFALQITAPVRQMQKAAAAIAQGNLNQRVPVRTRDELGDLAQAFNQMAGSLATAEAQRSRLLADIAHELRTPMSIIQANAEAIQDGVLALDLEQINTIHRETLLLGRLIDDLRLISLSESGQLQLERRLSDMAALLRHAADRLRPQCQQKGVDLVLTLPATLPQVNIDPDRINQVVNNLIGNALRYTPDGGAITLRADRVAGALLVSVTDIGAGIATEDLPWVFDRFYRVDKSRTRASGGSGLGLAIVRQLVEAHGGAVVARSPVYEEPSRGKFGTRIEFTLPLG